MDFRGTKVMDFVVATRNMSEYEKKTKALQIRWLHNWEWLADRYRRMERKLDKLCAEKLAREKRESTIKDDIDERTCLPFPRTTSENYGWLASKPEFALEKCGSFIVKYPDPTDEICVLGGDIPTLACGRGFY